MTVRVHGFDLTPEDRALLRGPLPAAARRWVREKIGRGARIVAARPRSGGTSSAIHAVTVDDATGARHHLVLRRFVRADWLEREPDLAEHEARVLALLESSDVLAPRIVAVDPRGEHCDVPAVLMTQLPGRVRWSPRNREDFSRRLVGCLLPIHAVPVPAATAIRAFSPYYEREELEPPPQSSCPGAWERAIAVHARPPPVLEHDLVHRDYHPGNVLWTGDAVTGIVDWASASLGSPEADVGHCRVNLARTLGYDTAERFTAIYRERSERGEYHPYWDLVTAVGMLDDADAGAGGWLPALDDFVARAVSRL